MGEWDGVVARLRSQVTRAEPILFVGAGFSLGAKSKSNQAMPTSADLTAEFWRLAFPSESFDPKTRLGDAFYSAKIQNAQGLKQLIEQRLSVDSMTLPDYYAKWFSVPWAGCYSLNIDDLELAALRRFQLPRGLYSVSATSGQIHGDSRPGNLETIHLNGAVWDKLEDLTFSAPDYGVRLAAPNQWLVRCTTDLVTHPVIFVGTELDESPLWQYLEFRKGRGEGRNTRELRPGSVLVSPSLNSARRLLLRELHVDWLPMTAQAFAEQIISQLDSSIRDGFRILEQKGLSEERIAAPQLISKLAVGDPTRKTDYLVGQEPEWVDLQSGRAIRRESDRNLLEEAQGILASSQPGKPLIITGTAGSGKSTSLMRLGLALAAQGVPSYWVDEGSNLAPHSLQKLVLGTETPLAILIDDADLLGRMATGWVRELPQIRPGVLVACAIRSSKVDGLLDRDTLEGIQSIEIAMPNLTDQDIQDLLRVLDQDNRLGVLKGMSYEDRVEVFRKEAGRQLLVAMIEATSGIRFTEKAVQEFSELPNRQRFLYGAICFVNSQRYTLSLDEVLAAVGSSDNETINDLELLVTRHIVVRDDRLTGYRSRHRVLAEQVVNSQEYRSQMRSILEGTYYALASHLKPNEVKTSRVWRRWIWFIRHEFLLHYAAPQDARDIYASLESLLEWDYHYWLQRGSLEVEEGDLTLAENFLGQARSLSNGDGFVETEWAYLLMKKAARYPRHTESPNWFFEGYNNLLGQIENRGGIDSYPYHVLGSQTLAWVRSASLPLLEKRNLLRKTLEIVKVGNGRHTRSAELSTLAKDLQAEWLGTALRQ